MDKRKMGWLVAMMVSLLLVLGACSSDDGSGESGGAADDNTIQVWTMSPEMEEFVTEYEEESGVKVEVQAIPWENAHDKLLTAVASGNGPDVLQIGTTWVAEFAEAGTFLDISDKISDYENLAPENFYEAAVETTQYDDQTIGVPWYVDTRALFYRKDLLKEAGYPEGPSTWEEMNDASEQLAARGEGKYAIDLPPNDPNFPFILAWQEGFNYEIGNGAANFESESFKNAVERYETYYENGWSQTGEGKEIFQAFKDGTKPMFFSGPWDIGTIKERAPEIEGKWDVKVMPKAENNKSMMGGAHWSVFHNSDKVEQSLDFINWMSDPETQLKWYETKSELPASLKAWEDPALADNPMVATFGEQLKSTQPLPLIPEYEQLGQELLKTIEQVTRGDADVDSAVKQYQQEAARILGE